MSNVPRRRFLGYTYENLEKDLGIFARVFHEYVQVCSLGQTNDSREVYLLRIGRQDAQKKVLFFGGIHGREYMTSQLLMNQSARFLSLLCKNKENYKGESYDRLMENSAVYVLPMLNPDGVSISQFGSRGIRDENLAKNVLEIAAREGGRQPCGAYFSKWKANASGVDLNRNFDAFWEEYEDEKGKPSFEKYKGTSPESERESKILAELTRKEKFCRTVSYHSSGRVIYWNFGQTGKLREETKRFAEQIAGVTGYEPDESFDKLDPAGYKDWALMKMKIPSITIEIGRLDSPMPQWCFQEILRENRNVWEETLVNL